MQLIVDNLLTNYTVSGNGKKVLLFLHGWADSGSTFDSLIQTLSINPQYKILTIDLPGFGSSQQPTEAWGLDQYAAFVKNFQNKLGLDIFAIVGHSNGGAIAIKGLSSGVLEADKLVLIASAGIRNSSYKKNALRVISKPAKLALKLAPKSTQQKVKSGLYKSIGSDYLVAEQMQETFKKIVSEDVTVAATNLTIPTCLIYGENDQATPPAYGLIFSEKIKNSQYHQIPLANHFVHQEQVPKVANIIEEFLK